MRSSTFHKSPNFYKTDRGDATKELFFILVMMRLKCSLGAEVSKMRLLFDYYAIVLLIRSSTTAPVHVLDGTMSKQHKVQDMCRYVISGKKNIISTSTFIHFQANDRKKNRKFPEQRNKENAVHLTIQKWDVDIMLVLIEAVFLCQKGIHSLFRYMPGAQ